MKIQAGGVFHNVQNSARMRATGPASGAVPSIPSLPGPSPKATMGQTVSCEECHKVYRSTDTLEDLRQNDSICLVCSNPIEVEDWDRVLASYDNDDYDDAPDDADEDDFGDDDVDPTDDLGPVDDDEEFEDDLEEMEPDEGDFTDEDHDALVDDPH